MDILFLCTGNICRSPAAEALLKHRLEEAGITGVKVHSAGSLGPGNEAAPYGVAILADQGIDMSAHRSTRWQDDDVERASLVLGMAKEHVIDAVAGRPDIFRKTFTLKEFVRRAEARDVRPWRADEPFEAWLEFVHGDRTSKEVFEARDIDIEDPIGRPRQFYEAMVEELDDLITRLVRIVWGEEPPAERAERAS